MRHLEGYSYRGFMGAFEDDRDKIFDDPGIASLRKKLSPMLIQDGKS